MFGQYKMFVSIRTCSVQKPMTPYLIYVFRGSHTGLQCFQIHRWGLAYVRLKNHHSRSVGKNIVAWGLIFWSTVQVETNAWAYRYILKQNDLVMIPSVLVHSFSSRRSQLSEGDIGWGITIFGYSMCHKATKLVIWKDGFPWHWQLSPSSRSGETGEFHINWDHTPVLHSTHFCGEREISVKLSEWAFHSGGFLVSKTCCWLAVLTKHPQQACFYNPSLK